MLLQVEGVYKSYRKRTGIFKKSKAEIVKGVSFSLERGTCLGIIGESGSGKSTLARMVIGIEDCDQGEVLINGSRFGRKSDKSLKKHVSVVFQDYVSSVNPRFTVRDIIMEPINAYGDLRGQARIDRVIDLLVRVGLSEAYLNRYPHELSGGQLQRVCIARAIANSPQLIVLDEAISSLDVSIQVQVLDLLVQLKEELNISYLFITHDITAVTYICDQVMFFKDGQIIELVDDMRELCAVSQPYSRVLLETALTMNAEIMTMKVEDSEI